MTIKDIARISGVSVSTVSRVLNNHPDVSEENRKKVKEAIEKTNYIPNVSAQNLVRTSSDAIGLVVRGISNPFYTDIIHAIEKQISNRGYTMVMQHIADNQDEIEFGAAMEREKRLNGIIFLGGRFDYSEKDMAKLNVPMICCSYTNQYGSLKADQYASVSIPDMETAAEATQYLIDKGHRKIAALISESNDCSISQLRYQGYKKALKDNGIEFDSKYTLESIAFDIKSAYKIVKESLENKNDYTAIFAISDNMAMGAMKAIRDAGLSVPEDISIIAIDGIEISNYFNPQLTTYCQPMKEMGKKSVDILLDIIEEKDTERHIASMPKLRVGESVKNI